MENKKKKKKGNNKTNKNLLTSRFPSSVGISPVNLLVFKALLKKKNEKKK